MSAPEPQTTAESEAREALQAAIEGLYQAFASYPLRPHVEGCTHCVSSQDEARLHSKPLRELTVEDLDSYAGDALSVWGGQDDFRHFLPRLFELLAFDSFRLTNPEILLGKPEYAGWRNWPRAEQTAIQTYIAALWPFVLVRSPFADDGEWTAEEYLCGIAQAIDDLGPLLNHWRISQETWARYHLSQPVLWAGRDLAHGELVNPFREDRQAQMHQVIEWLLEPATIQVLEQARKHSPPAIAAELLEAAERLAQLRSRDRTQQQGT